MFPKPDLNHSKLLLTSCLGWLFEVSIECVHGGHVGGLKQ